MYQEEQVNKKEDSWLKHYWRPAIAWQYFAVCLFDFLLAPILSALFAVWTDTPYVPWVPITLGEAGFYHMAMGAIVGVTAWTRGREKIERMYCDNDTRYPDISDFNTPIKDDPDARFRRF